MIITLYMLGMFPSYYYLLNTDYGFNLTLILTVLWPLMVALVLTVGAIQLIRLILTGKC